MLAIGAPETPPTGTSDQELLIWIEENGYILVTENRSTMPVHLSSHFAAGRHIPGVFYIRPGVSIGRIIEELYLIWFASQAEEYQDRILFIPL